MKKNISISEAEWKVMQILWENPKSTIKEITTALKDSDWSYSTIRTLVIRLQEKGAVGADTTIGNYKYYPLVSEEECRKKETENFLKKIYNGSLKMLVANLSKDKDLTDKEVEELMNIIDKIEGGDKDELYN